MEFISAVELACQRLSDQDGQELMVEINFLLKRAKTPGSNITKEEKKAVKELREDKDRIVLTADKGVAMVEWKAYWHNWITRPSLQTQQIKLKAKLLQKLKRIKRETNMEEGMHRTMYPTGCTTPKFYGLPKIHKTSTPSGQ